MTFDPTSVEVTCVTLPKDHCVQFPWEYINVCGYRTNFANYHIHTHTAYILHTYYVQNQWSHSLFLNYVQARQKWCNLSFILWDQVLNFSDIITHNLYIAAERQLGSIAHLSWYRTTVETQCSDSKQPRSDVVEGSHSTVPATVRPSTHVALKQQE